jgi:oligopeptide/dipeptide ABC transporter ATP-binding protein
MPLIPARAENGGSEMTREPLLDVTGLTTEFATEDGAITAIEDVSFDLAPGETLGIVGESGSGKSVTARAVIRLLDDNGRIAAGSIRFRGTDLTTLDDALLPDVRGNDIAMVFQDPMTSLTPVLTVGTQIIETIQHHQGVSAEAARDRAVELLDRVRIPDPVATLETYPHELSGGQRQRVLIAIAVSCDPDVLIADEPTTALDVTIEAQILDLLEELTAENDMALIQITHDLGVIAETCDRVAVMYAGRVVETGAVETVFTTPRHPYTAGLLRSMPQMEDVEPELLPGTVPDPAARPAGCNFAPRCPHATDECHADDPPLEPVIDSPGARRMTDGAGTDRTAACIHTNDLGPLDPLPDAEMTPKKVESSVGDHVLGGEDLSKEFTSAGSLIDRLLPGGDPPVRAVDGVDFAIRNGETFGLVGESGSGKTTLGRLLISLTEPTEGEVVFDGRRITDVPESELRERVQFIFQDPSSSLNPRQTVGDILGYAIRKHDTNENPSARAAELLEEVGLDADTRSQYPYELSGGQKQRVGVARALAVDPDVLIADEPTSALDVSVQGQLLALLEDIRQERGLSMVFISHDLSLIRQVADRVAVMYLGRIVEVGETERVFESPLHPYTEALMSAVPDPDPTASTDRIILDGEIPDPRRPPEGCNFVTRCPKAFSACEHYDPALATVDDGEVACLLHTDMTRRDKDG